MAKFRPIWSHWPQVSKIRVKTDLYIKLKPLAQIVMRLDVGGLFPFFRQRACARNICSLMCICIHDERGLASSCAFICDLLHAFFNFPMTLIKSLNLKLKKWLTHVFSQFPARKPSLRLILAIFYNCKMISHHSTTTYVQSLST